MRAQHDPFALIFLVCASTSVLGLCRERAVRTLGVATLLAEQHREERDSFAASVHDLSKAFDSVSRYMGKERSLRRLGTPDSDAAQKACKFATSAQAQLRPAFGKGLTRGSPL